MTPSRSRKAAGLCVVSAARDVHGRPPRSAPARAISATSKRECRACSDGHSWCRPDDGMVGTGEGFRLTRSRRARSTAPSDRGWSGRKFPLSAFRSQPRRVANRSRSISQWWPPPSPECRFADRARQIADPRASGCRDFGRHCLFIRAADHPKVDSALGQHSGGLGVRGPALRGADRPGRQRDRRSRAQSLRLPPAGDVFGGIRSCGAGHSGGRAAPAGSARAPSCRSCGAGPFAPTPAVE